MKNSNQRSACVPRLLCGACFVGRVAIYTTAYAVPVRYCEISTSCSSSSFQVNSGNNVAEKQKQLHQEIVGLKSQIEKKNSEVTELQKSLESCKKAKESELKKGKANITQLESSRDSLGL